MRQDKLYLGLVKGEGYGWGVCSKYLIHELAKHKTVKVLQDVDGSAENGSLDGDLFQALTNIDFDPMFPRARGRHDLGYAFFENELTSKSVENAKRFALVLGGSTWCRDRMLEKGITNCGVLIQGIDPEIFYPIPPQTSDERFVIFSGGKFELRKGQDIVLKAVKIMQERYPDVWLINCWYNLWPASARLMNYSAHIHFQHQDGESWDATMRRTYIENGLDPGRIITSGHKDILTEDNSLMLSSLSDYHVKDASGRLIARWKECSLEELLAHLEYAYHNRSAIQTVGRQAGEDLKGFTWSHSAEHLVRFFDNSSERERYGSLSAPVCAN
ncbi:MAG: hypothetical protein P8X55_11665 [Desulfosarcinaceae bacterium]